MEKKNNEVALNFRAYLDKIGCSFRSMEEYDRMLRLSFNSYLSEYPSYSNFYDCTDSSLVSRIFDRMNADPYYKELNIKWRGVPENAFRHYISFLYVSKGFRWKENSTIGFYKFLTEEKNVSVTNAGKIIDILKNKNEVKAVLKAHNLEGTEVLSIVNRIVDDIINLYDGDNKELAIQGGKYLLEYGLNSLPKSKMIQILPAKIEKIQKEIRVLLSDRGIRNMSFSVAVDGSGQVRFL
ncbi:MAG: hypothetical protein J6Y78_00405 [Paludibacteraceae bacterium]|nr:hypothetical protein [Paludibacteraceae bacterium]